MMNTKYLRIGRAIRTIESDEVQVFNSINLAKKESARLQITEKKGFLGCGVLMVA